jgi:hypothetical protein
VARRLPGTRHSTSSDGLISYVGIAPLGDALGMANIEISPAAAARPVPTS